ncbi:cytochrome c-type biogenesis CcmF C-terminal domain-containing protein [Ensifer adhaerens]|uniref:cytochrome c-type biogenesis CcmF C-terminal domain-containing protein n=1 Tax=Ensifer adhaerens TaxID=106592 RepID=UPI00384A806B
MNGFWRCSELLLDLRDRRFVDGPGAALRPRQGCRQRRTETVVEMKPGMTVDAGGHELRFDGIREGSGPNYSEDLAHFTIGRGGVAIDEVWSSKRFYQARRMPRTEAGSRTFGLSQLYVSLGDQISEGGKPGLQLWAPNNGQRIRKSTRKSE